MRERAGERAAEYLRAMSQSLKSLKTEGKRKLVNATLTDHVSNLARDYTKDAKYYLDAQKPVTALACIAYAEGLLDALKLLRLAEF